MSNVKDEIVIRDITDLAEMRQVEDIQSKVWGDDPREIVPTTLMVANREVGGTLVGAFDGERLVGFTYGFYGFHNNRPVLHSQMLAVLTSHRNLNLGYMLKLAQRDRVLARGVRRITWTFDPLQAVNAHFNFNKLGVVSDTYKTDFYGGDATSFLLRNGTDRFFVTWLLDSERVAERLAIRLPASEPRGNFAGSVSLLRVDDDGTPLAHDRIEITDQRPVTIEIPGDINSVQREQPELARAWREATRRAFVGATSSGYIVAEFARAEHDGRRIGKYLLCSGCLDDFISQPVETIDAIG